MPEAFCNGHSNAITKQKGDRFEHEIKQQNDNVDWLIR